MKFDWKQSRWLLAAALLLFTAQTFGHGMSEAEKQSIIDGGNLRYVWIGATHMLSGYDHLLFVFGIVFFLSTFKEIVKYITAFTVGHSITLIWATFSGIQVNYFLIDAIIGLSVSYIAFSNLNGFKLLLDVKPPSLLVMITALGLIHGLGLSTRLQQLPLNQQDLLMNIISFNVGIELGQILALTVMLMFLAAWRKKPSFRPFSLIANYTLIAAGAYLFLMQMHGYSHTSHPDEFGFSADNHIHEHIKMDEENAARILKESKRETID
jgi:HupE / UreJ protein